MNYTNKYQLPQWIKSDRILMYDFNNSMAAIENGMAANASATSAAQSAANSAKSTATSAKSTAETALTKAQSTFYIGKYTGTGSECLHVCFLVKPKFIIIYGGNSTTELSEAQNHMQYFFMGGGEKILYQIELREDGFKVFMDPSRVRYPILNEKGRVYEFIVFR